MFRLDEERMILTFTIGDRDLALALADVESFELRDWCRQPGTVLSVDFGGRRDHVTKGRGIVPSQVAPGIYAYRIVRKR